MDKADSQKSRRTTPWEASENLSATQVSFIQNYNELNFKSITYSSKELKGFSDDDNAMNPVNRVPDIIEYLLDLHRNSKSITMNISFAKRTDLGIFSKRVFEPIIIS